jgi:hypothetical protein
LTLFDAIFHPPVSHVERLGELLAHFGIEDSLSRVVVGLKRGACGRLAMAEFLESSAHGMLTT